MPKTISITATQIKRPPLLNRETDTLEEGARVADGTDWEASIFMLLPEGMWGVVLKGTKEMHSPGDGAYFVQKGDDSAIYKRC